MKNKVFDDDGLEISEDGGRFFVRYDVGAHQVVMREDEITPAQADRMMKSPNGATEVLFEIQKDLIRRGVDPYKSNI